MPDEGQPKKHFGCPVSQF